MAIIQIKRGTAAEWNAANPILALAELGLETDTNKMKAGDGVTAWSGLTYMTGDGGGGGAVESVNGRIGQVMLDKTDVGLGVVDNTSDLDKPISTATQTALDAKATDASVAAIDGRVTTNETNIATNSSDISALQTTSGGNTGDIAALDGRVTTNEADIATNTSGISDLQTRLTVVEDKIGPSTQTLLNTDVTIYADGNPATADPLGSGGWYYTNPGGGEKINWYFFGQGGGALTELVTLGDLQSVYGLFIPRSNETRIPFAALYTAPQGDEQDAAVWYRSRIVWEILPNQAGVPNTGGTAFNWPTLAPGIHEPLLAWAGQTDPDVFTNVTHYQMLEQSFVTVGPKDPSEVVLFLVLGSDSSESAGGYNFVVKTTGADLSEGGYQSTLIAIPGVDVPSGITYDGPDGPGQEVVY